MSPFDSVILRSAESADVARLIELNAHVHRPHVEAHPDLFRSLDDREDVGEYFASIVDDPTQYVLVAEIDFRSVGYAAASVQRRPAHVFAKAHDRLYVHQISVDPRVRRRGVGRALVVEIERIARRESIGEVSLDTWWFNDAARRFFEALGYSVYNVRMWKRDLDD